MNKLKDKTKDYSEYNIEELFKKDLEAKYVSPKVLMNLYGISRKTVIKACNEGVNHIKTRANRRKIDENSFFKWYILNG